MSGADAPVAQLVEHVLGKDEVSGSKPLGGLYHILKIFCYPCEAKRESNVARQGGAQENRKDMRETIHFQCTACNRITYNSTKDKKQKPERLELKKFCRFCRKHVLHKETKK